MGGPETTTPTPCLPYTLVAELDRPLGRNDDTARRLTCQSGAPTTQPSLRPRIHPRTTQHGSRRSPPRTCHPTSTATTARRLRHRSRGIIPRQHQQCLRLHPHRKRRKRSEAEAQKKKKRKKESKDTGRATSRRRRRR